MSAVPTVKVADDAADCGWRLINESELDLDVHELYQDKASVPMDELFQAIDAMEREGNPDYWTEGAQLPKTDVLSSLVGRKVSATERDKAWAHYGAVKRNAGHA